MPSPLAKRVLIVGWDAADWKIMTPLLEQGRMPHLDSLINRGVMGNIASMTPMLSPMLWNSIATGKRAHKHGIYGFVEPNEEGSALRPVSSRTRQAKALWNILTQRGMTSNVVGWFCSHPAEPINGAFVSEYFPKASADPNQWPLAPDAVHPEPLGETLADLRVHPSEIDGYSLLPFVPKAAAINQAEDQRLAKIAVQLAECASVHTAATWLMENQPADLTAVYYNTIDHMCHLAMAFHPPRMPQAPDEVYELYKNVVTETYVWHDALLGRLLELAGEETTVILCSDHGFHSDHLRPAWTPKTPTGPTAWHRFHGALVMAGPGIKKDERVYGATLLDIAPTVLTLMGLPVGLDMDGKVLSSAFEEPPAVEIVPSWESVDGECGMHPAGQYEEPFEAYALMKQMAELGYVEMPDENAAESIERIRRDSQFNRAQALLNANMAAEALPLLEDLHRTDPDHLYYGLNLATCYRQAGRFEECRKTALQVLEYCRDEQKIDSGIRPAEIDEETWKGIPAAKRPRIVAQADLLLGLLELEEGNARAALTHFESAEKIQPRSPHVRVSLGRCMLLLRRYADAERNFKMALDVDADDHRALDGLAEACLGMQRNEEAAEHALDAVGLLHHLPSGHYHLGIALARLQQPERALQAFDQCLAMQPRHRDAHAWRARMLQTQAAAVGAEA